MHLSPVSATPPGSKTAVATAGGDDAPQGFDALLAAMLPAPDMPTDLIADAAPPAAGAEAHAAVPTDAVASLLASLPRLHDPALPALISVAPGPDGRAAVDDSAVEAGNSAALLSGVSGTTGQVSQPSDRTAPRAGTEAAPERLPKPLMAGASHDNAGGRLPDRTSDRLPVTDGAPVQPRKPEHDAGPPMAPAIFTADQRAGLATTELPARQTVLPVAPPLSSPGWSRAFSEQVMWVARAEFLSASLTLNPPELGPVTIELQIDDTQASASFNSAQPEVRKAIDDALPMLKTLFAEAGLDLRHTDVGSGAAHQRHDQEAPRAAGRMAGTPADGSMPEAAVAPMARPSRGLLDTFA